MQNKFAYIVSLYYICIEQLKTYTMSKQSIDKLEQKIASMSNEQWQNFAAQVKKDLELAKLRARIKKIQPTSKDIIEELIDTSVNN
jgi:ribosomal protein L11